LQQDCSPASSSIGPCAPRSCGVPGSAPTSSKLGLNRSRRADDQPRAPASPARRARAPLRQGRLRAPAAAVAGYRRDVLLRPADAHRSAARHRDRRGLAAGQEALERIADELVRRAAQLIRDRSRPSSGFRYPARAGLRDSRGPRGSCRASAERVTTFPPVRDLPEFETPRSTPSSSRPPRPSPPRTSHDAGAGGPPHRTHPRPGPRSPELAAQRRTSSRSAIALVEQPVGNRGRPRCRSRISMTCRRTSPSTPRSPRVEHETSSGRERRKYVRTIADAEPEKAALARIAIRRVAVAPPASITEPSPASNTLGETTRSIRRATIAIASPSSAWMRCSGSRRRATRRR